MKKLLSLIFGLTLSLFIVGQVNALETPYLNGSYAGGDRVNLSWSQVPGASYQVIYGPVDNPSAHGAALGTETSYTVGALFQNTSYVFSIKAVRDGDVSALSNSITVRIGGAGRAALPAQATSTVSTPAPVGSQVDGRIVTPAVYYDQSQDTMQADAAPNDPYISSGKPGYGLQNVRTTRGPRPGEITLHWNEPMASNVGFINVVYTDEYGIEKWGVLNIPGEARSLTIGRLTSGVRYWFWIANERTGRTPWVSDLAL